MMMQFDVEVATRPRPHARPQQLQGTTARRQLQFEAGVVDDTRIRLQPQLESIEQGQRHLQQHTVYCVRPPGERDAEPMPERL